MARSSPTASTRTVNGPSSASIPASSAVPGTTGTGALSPVRIAASQRPDPASTVPSAASRSPAATSMVAPTAISSARCQTAVPLLPTSIAPGALACISAAAPARARARIAPSSTRPASRKNSSMIAPSNQACAPPVTVSYSDMAVARVTPIEIGTSILVRPRRSALHADAKKGRPDQAMAGTAISADSQWNRSRLLSAAPDQTLTDSSMTFIAANPAMASALSRRRCSVSVGGASASGWAAKPIRSSAATRPGTARSGRWTMRTCFSPKSTRAVTMPALSAKPCSILAIHPAQRIPGTDSRVSTHSACATGGISAGRVMRYPSRCAWYAHRSRR